MAGDSLQTVLQIERHVQEALAEERRQSAAWLEDQRATIDRESEAEQAALRKLCEGRERAVCQAAEREAVGALEEARQATAQFAAIEDAILERIVVRHLRRLLPEGEP